MFSGVCEGSASAGSKIVVVYVKLCGFPPTITLPTLTVIGSSPDGFGHVAPSARLLAVQTMPGPAQSLRSMIVAGTDTLPGRVMVTVALVKSAPASAKDQRGNTTW